MNADTTYTLRDVAARLCVSVATVRAWIRSGELRGVCVSRTPGTAKPRFVVRESDLLAFEARRATGGAVKPRRRAKLPPSRVLYYPE